MKLNIRILATVTLCTGPPAFSQVEWVGQLQGVWVGKRTAQYTHVEHQQYAESFGGDLLTVPSYQSLETIRVMLFGAVNDPPAVHSGAFWDDTPGQWAWEDGSAWTFDPFVGGAPTGSPGIVGYLDRFSGFYRMQITGATTDMRAVIGLASDDCDGNGTPDLWEIFQGAQDLNGNQVLDSCEPDCNNNNIPDDWDIQTGTSLDCNSNGIPDDCEEDCNGNGIPDSCDITNGTSNDCQGNSIPDECETGPDWDQDGVPDECEQIGTRYCSPNAANSTGLPGSLTILGSVEITDNHLAAIATELPAFQFGYLLGSTSQDLVQFPGGSLGILCLGAPIVRFNMATDGGAVVNSGSLGIMLFSPDLLSFPQGLVISAGDSWNFQFWYRDVNPLPTSNFTDAVSITFQ